MQNLLKSFVTERLGKPLDKKLRGNQEYIKSQNRYHIQMEQLKKKLGSDKDSTQFALELDEIVGEYSGHYGETAYILGFHDGLDIGLEHGKQYGRESNLENTDMVVQNDVQN